jgi:hypothetical protein
MNLYRSIEAEYRQLGRTGLPAEWRIELAGLDDVVAAIRGFRTDPLRSDQVLRHLVAIARADARAGVVVIYALAPLLRARLGRTATEDYRTDALSELFLVVMDSPVDGPRLAHRLVNRAHNRVYKAALRVRQRGVVHPIAVIPVEPDELARNLGGAVSDIADQVAERVDLDRFCVAVQFALDSGELSPSLWAAFCAHRLRRILDPGAPAANGIKRKLATRAVPRLQPYVDQHLHAA